MTYSGVVFTLLVLLSLATTVLYLYIGTKWLRRRRK